MIHPRAKIVCTLGPSSRDVPTIKALILAGMDVARLNFSHGTPQEHRSLIAAVRQAGAEAGKMVAILGDLQGPKVRVGLMEGGEAVLEPGAEITLTTEQVLGTAARVSTSYLGLPADVGPEEVLLLDDGLMALRVKSVQGTEILCEVAVGGVLKNNKGINIPGAALSVAASPPKDLADANFAVGQNLDFLAMSFVRNAEDVLRMREHLRSKGAEMPLISKIEKPQAVAVIDEIIAVSDGIMVARGDLGVEMPAETVPGIQKTIIQKCNAQGVPVITATQMLDSMIQNPRPTRAEASDVANAILDGSDAVMLSGESASGKYPREAVAVMQRIILATEQPQRPPLELARRRAGDPPRAIYDAVAMGACFVAGQVDAKAIACITLSGSIARTISKYRPAQPIYAVSQHEHVLRRLTLDWGVRGLLMKNLTMENIDEAAPEVEAALLREGKIKKGELFVLTAGLPFSGRKATNMVRVETAH